jgi:hypothetical protein
MIWRTSYGLWQLCHGVFAISFNSLEGTLFDESVIRNEAQLQKMIENCHTYKTKSFLEITLL